MIKAIIFDLDETLISSKEWLLQYFRDMYAYLDLPFPEEQREIFYTAPEKGFLEMMFEDREIREKARAFKGQYAAIKQVTPLKLKPYAKDVLDTLRQHYLLAIATNRGPTTPDVLEHFDITDYFKVVVHARTLAEPKPHPLVTETIMRDMGVTAEETIFVGDSQIDVLTAEAGGIPCVIVGDNAKAGLGDYQLDDLSGLPDLIDSLSSK